MPIYTYRCVSCEGVFEVFHLMSEELDTCSLCEVSGTVEKIPSMLAEKPTATIKKSRVGDVVENYIKDAKKEIQQEKKKLKSKEA